MGGLYSRIKTWTSTEDVTAADLNAEFDNVLTYFTPQYMDDYSSNTSQMQTTTDPGEVGTESRATTLAGEIERLRFIIKEITGEDYWYETPTSSILGLANALGGGLPDNRLVSGRLRATSAQPVFLVPNGAARTVKLDGTPTNFVYYVNGTQYTISTDVTLTGLTAAPSSNNTALINDAVAADQYWTKYQGEDGTEIPVDNMGSEIQALVGKFAAFKLAGTTDEYFIAYVKSTTALTKARRGYFFDSSDAPVPRAAYTDNDVITLMKLSWIFAKTDGTLTVAYTNPNYGKDEPTSPAVGDYWFDTDNETWKMYNGTSFASAGATLVGCCIQDATNTVGARSFEFFLNYTDVNTFEVMAESNSQVKSRRPGGQANVWGTTIHFDQNLITWDMTLDLESGVTESASTYYYFYLTEEGDKIISDKKPLDRREDLQGFYHPHHSWRCLGWAFNNASSNLEQVESYYRGRESEVIRSVAAADYLLTRDRVILFSGASFTEYLPPAAACRGNIYTFIHNGTSLSQIYTIDGNASETIGGSTTVKMHTNGQMLKIISDGSNWLILESYAASGPNSFTPASTGTHSTNVTYSGVWWRQGHYAIINARAAFSGATDAATGARCNLPTGMVASLELVASGVGICEGSAVFVDSGNPCPGVPVLTATSYIMPYVIDNDSATNHNLVQVSTTHPVTIGNGDSWEINCRIPITDWLP